METVILSEPLSADLAQALIEYILVAAGAAGLGGPVVMALAQLVKKLGSQAQNIPALAFIEKTPAPTIALVLSMLIWGVSVVANATGEIELYQNTLTALGSLVFGIGGMQIGAAKSFNLAKRNSIGFFGYARTPSLTDKNRIVDAQG